MAQNDICIDEILQSFSQRCKTEEDGIQAKCHCEEILRKNDWLLETNVLNVFLNHQGTLNSFEVSVDDSIENRVGQLVNQMKEKISEYGVIQSIMVSFLVNKECEFQIKEILPFADISSILDDDTDIWYGISYDDKRNNQMRAIVMVMHE